MPKNFEIRGHSMVLKDEGRGTTFRCQNDDCGLQVMYGSDEFGADKLYTEKVKIVARRNDCPSSREAISEELEEVGLKDELKSLLF